MSYTKSQLKQTNCVVCDICGNLANDTLSEQCKSEGVEKLCSECGFCIYTFEKKLMRINSSRDKESRFDRFALIKAKAICMKAGLNMQVSEPVIAKARFSFKWMFFKKK